MRSMREEIEESEKAAERINDGSLTIEERAAALVDYLNSGLWELFRARNLSAFDVARETYLSCPASHRNTDVALALLEGKADKYIAARLKEQQDGYSESSKVD